MADKEAAVTPEDESPDAEPLTQPHPDEPIIAADGHVILSAEDIKARKAADKEAAKS